MTIPLTPLDQLSAPPESALDHAPARAQAPTPYVAEALRWLPRVATAEGRPQTGAGPGSGARAGFVLIADANADMRGYLRRLLLPHWPIEEVATAAEALELARTQAPSLILIDVLLPDMDGLHLVRLLRTDAATAALPVILLSAQQGEEMIVAGLEAGADDYLTKPFVASEFLARVEVHTTLSRLRREASQLREEYIAAFAHDLHTPFTSIQVGVGLLQADAARYLPQPAREVLDTVQRNIQRLALHLSDLVTVNQLNAGVLQTRSETLDLRLLVGEALNTVQPLFQEKGQTTQVRLPDELLVRGDARRTQQVLMNVLMNAHRHTPMGTTITVERYVGPAEAGVVICDNGAGIAPQHRERIFERHQRLDTVSGGSGLGLTIARSLLGLQGGRIWAEAADGGGACFFIVLPVADRRSSESMEEES